MTTRSRRGVVRNVGVAVRCRYSWVIPMTPRISISATALDGVEGQLLELRRPHRGNAGLAVLGDPGQAGDQRGEARDHRAGTEEQAQPHAGAEQLGPLGSDQPGHRVPSWVAGAPAAGAANCSCPAVSWK